MNEFGLDLHLFDITAACLRILWLNVSEWNFQREIIQANYLLYYQPFQWMLKWESEVKLLKHQGLMFVDIDDILEDLCLVRVGKLVTVCCGHGTHWADVLIWSCLSVKTVLYLRQTCQVFCVLCPQHSSFLKYSLVLWNQFNPTIRAVMCPRSAACRGL